MNIVGQSCDLADFLKILPENWEEITSSLCDNNIAVLGPNSINVWPTTLP